MISIQVNEVGFKSLFLNSNIRGKSIQFIGSDSKSVNLEPKSEIGTGVTGISKRSDSDVRIAA